MTIMWFCLLIIRWEGLKANYEENWTKNEGIGQPTVHQIKIDQLHYFTSFGQSFSLCSILAENKNKTRSLLNRPLPPTHNNNNIKNTNQIGDQLLDKLQLVEQLLMPKNKNQYNTISIGNLCIY